MQLAKTAVFKVDIMTISSIVVLLLLRSFRAGGLIQTFDTSNPLIRLSPVKSTGVQDQFGFSVSGHQFFKSSTSTTFEDAINQTV